MQFLAHKMSEISLNNCAFLVMELDPNSELQRISDKKMGGDEINSQLADRWSKETGKDGSLTEKHSSNKS